MRKLFVHPAIRTYRETLYRMLGRAGFAFLFTMINPAGTHAGEETDRILETFDCDWFQCREIKRFPVTNFSWDLWRTLRSDVVIFSCLTSIPFLLAAPVLKLLGKRVLLFDETWRYQHENRRYRLLYPYVRFLIRRCVSAVIAAGSRAGEMYRQDFGVADKRIFIAYNTTLDLMQAPQCEKRRAEIAGQVGEKAGGRKVVLYLGRLVQYKGLDILIRAMAQMGAKTCLVVVGSGPFQEECERLTTELELRDRVHFLGGCLSEDSLYYYLAADVFVLPSRFLPAEPVNCESWGFTLNEAMSLEIPVVATTAVGAAFDLIEDGVTGMMAEENDAASLAAKLRILLCDESKRAAIGRQGRRHLLERCSYEQNFEAFNAAVDYAVKKANRA